MRRESRWIVNPHRCRDLMLGRTSAVDRGTTKQGPPDIPAGPVTFDEVRLLHALELVIGVRVVRVVGVPATGQIRITRRLGAGLLCACRFCACRFRTRRFGARPLSTRRFGSDRFGA